MSAWIFLLFSLVRLLPSRNFSLRAVWYTFYMYPPFCNKSFAKPKGLMILKKSFEKFENVMIDLLQLQLQLPPMG